MHVVINGRIIDSLRAGIVYSLKMLDSEQQIFAVRYMHNCRVGTGPHCIVNSTFEEKIFFYKDRHTYQ